MAGVAQGTRFTPAGTPQFPAACIYHDARLAHDRQLC